LVSVDSLDGVPGTILFLGCALASYLLGHLTYGLGKATNRILPARRKRHPDAREEFLSRVPSARGKAFVDADVFLLLARLQVLRKDAATEVARLRAGGLMLRNSTPPLLAAAIVVVVEGVTAGKTLLAACCGILLLVAALRGR